MTIGELIQKLSKYPSDYKAVIDVSSDYEDYDEVDSIKPCAYGRFRGGSINESGKPNAVILR